MRGVFSTPPLEVFLAVFFKDINYVPQTYLTFTNHLFATFRSKNFQTIELTGHVICPYLEAGSKQIIVFDDFNGKVERFDHIMKYYTPNESVNEEL